MHLLCDNKSNIKTCNNNLSSEAAAHFYTLVIVSHTLTPSAQLQLGETAAFTLLIRHQDRES